MAYSWQTKIQRGSMADDSFYTSIQNTYTEVVNNHCPSNYSTYKGTNYSNKTDRSSVTTCSSNYTGDDVGDNNSYSCSSDYSSNYSSNYSTNKSSDNNHYSGDYFSDNGHDGGDK